MKHIRIALLVTSALIATSTAHAAVVTMLQFGSYETRAEAEKRLSEVGSKYKVQLSGLDLAIREVTLPDSDFKVYRTQAGPIETRANAQGICAQFASAGDECYVVQSAMGSSPAKNTSTKAATVAPAATSEISENAPSTTPDVSSIAVASRIDLAPQTTTAQPDLTQHLTLMQGTEADQKAPVTVESVANNPADYKGEKPASVTESSPVPEDSAQIKSANDALDVAADSQASTAELVVNATKQNVANHGFWFWMNPLHWAGGKDENAAPAVEAQNVAAEMPASDVTAVETPAVQEAPVASDSALASPEPLAPQGATAESAVEVTTAPAIGAQQPPVSLNPRSTDGIKSSWLQIGPFAKREEALGFWSHYREANPDFPVLRVRTVTNYQQEINGITRTWLRVGPVTRQGLIDAVCGSLPKESTLKCSTVIDTGVDASKDQPAAGSRYKR